MGRVHPEPPRHSAAGQLRPGEGRAAWGADDTGNLVWSPLDWGQLCPRVSFHPCCSKPGTWHPGGAKSMLLERVNGRCKQGRAGLYLNSFH